MVPESYLDTGFIEKIGGIYKSVPITKWLEVSTKASVTDAFRRWYADGIEQVTAPDEPFDHRFVLIRFFRAVQCDINFRYWGDVAGAINTKGQTGLYEVAAAVASRRAGTGAVVLPPAGTGAVVFPPA